MHRHRPPVRWMLASIRKWGLSGEMIANVIATFAQFERRPIGQRTKNALAVKKREAVRLGRPLTVDDAVVKHITRGTSTGWVASEDRRRTEPG